MYSKAINIGTTHPNNVTDLPSLNIFALYPKCIVRTPRDELIILLPIALGIAGLHSNTAKNNSFWSGYEHHESTGRKNLEESSAYLCDQQQHHRVNVVDDAQQKLDVFLPPSGDAA